MKKNVFPYPGSSDRDGPEAPPGTHEVGVAGSRGTGNGASFLSGKARPVGGELHSAKVSFQPIAFKKLSELIENHIRELILKGEIEPGERLPTEGEIGRQFSVSLVTVREALKGLETYGLIEKKKGKGGGIFVAEVRSEAVKIPLFHFLNQKNFSARDLSELRMIIEPLATKIAAGRISEAKLDELKANIEHCEALIKGASPDLSENDFFTLEKSNIEFHRLIGEATKNPVLLLTIDYVLDFLFNFKKMTLIPNLDFSNGVIRDHRLIYSQLTQRKGKAAERTMVLHLEHVEEYLTGKKGEKSIAEGGRGGNRLRKTHAYQQKH